MKLVFALLGAIVIVTTALPLIRKDAWWIRVFDFPRAQLAVLALAVWVGYLFVWDKQAVIENLFVAAVAACGLYQGYRIYPYTPVSPKQVQESRQPRRESRLSLMVANVCMHNRDAAKLKRMIRESDPDIVLTVETDHWWRTQPEEIETQYPHGIYHPLDNTYGMVLQSKLELIGSEVKFLVQTEALLSYIIPVTVQHLPLPVWPMVPTKPAKKDSGKCGSYKELCWALRVFHDWAL